MPSGSSAGLSSLPSSFSLSEHKSDSSSPNSHTVQPQPSSAAPPVTADQLIEFSVSSEEPANSSQRHQQTQTGPIPWPGRTRSVLRRYSPLVPPAALLIALVVMLIQGLAKAHSDTDSLDLPNEPVLRWRTCTLDNTVANNYNLSAQCVTVTLPLCYDGVCDVENEKAAIDVFLKRIPAIGVNDTSVSRQTVWYLPDRPDIQTRNEAELQMALLYKELRGEMDIYTLDLRGTGNSTALTCYASNGSPLQTAIFARNDGVLDFRDLELCAKRLQELGYTNLSVFSLVSASRDVEQVITQFHPESQAVVYGLGYGTLLAQHLVQRGIAQVVGYVFDGALGSSRLSPGAEASYEVSKSDEDFGEVSVDFLAWCQVNTDCSKMFSTMTINTTLPVVYAQLDGDTTSTCSRILMDNVSSGSNNYAANTTTPPSYLLRQLLGLMMKDTAMWPFIPVAVYRFHRCGSEDFALLTQFVKLTFATNDDVATPEFLYAIQAFSELWESRSPDQAELTERFANAPISSDSIYTQLQAYYMFTGDISDACANTSVTTNSSSIKTKISYTGKLTNTSSTTLHRETSILLFSGTLDALSPPKYTAALFDAYQTDNKALLEAPNGAHGVVGTALLPNGTACARYVLASYIRSNGDLSAYDASCMTALRSPNLTISNDSSLLVLGVENAYNGVLRVPNRNSNDSADILTDSGNLASSTSSGSTLDEINNYISALESSRHQYKVALIVVTILMGSVVLAGAMAVIYRHRRKHQLIGEEGMLRRRRGDDDDELELMHSIYLLSNSIGPPDI
ncbi:hypothetical protein PHMEG_00025037 [Phytophthora megakarya]|uniref:Serine protease n=1 Tax=Phytophthora megakarya TaxID=4795 RepID=A0A225VC40_9STRA|nr:hypothetical protein PHMEG_00025037 [Phytophthora megakarya]